MLGMNSGAELVAWLHILSLVSIQLLFQSPQLLVYAYNVRLKILMFVKKREKSTLIHLYIRWTFKQGGGGGAYIRNNIFVSKSMGLYPGGLKTGGALTWDFTVIT